MAGIYVPIDPNAVVWKEDVSASLPAPSLSDKDPPGTRFPQTMVQWMHLAGKNKATFKVYSPAKAAVRKFTLPSSLGTVSDFLELSPLPFAIAKELRALPGGVPTFYLASDKGTSVFNDDELRDANQILWPDVKEVYFGVLFQDRVSLAPRVWIDMLWKATNKDANWQAFGSQMYTPLNQTEIRVLDHTGAPINQAKLEYKDAKGAIKILNAGKDGNIALSDTATEFRWKGDPAQSADTLPVISLYENGTSAAPGGWLSVPAKPGLWHAQVLDLSLWFSKPPNGVNVSRYHADCRIEQIVDGIATFRRLVDDLLASASPGHGAHLAGWVFKDFVLDSDRGDDTKFSTLINKIRNGGGDVRLLVNQKLSLKKGVDNIAIPGSLIGLALAPCAPAVAELLGNNMKTDLSGYICLAVAIPVLISLIGTGTVSAKEIADKKFEDSKPLVDILEAIQPDIAIWDSYPAKFEDNPIKTELPGLPLDIENCIDQVGTWHQKMQIVKHKDSAGGSQCVAYLGGIDINENRIDCPGHQTWSPMHDVQARISGPAVADVCQTWSERYERVKVLPPVFDPPTAASLPKQFQKHLVQIGRTYFKPINSQPLSFAPKGDATITNTLIQAVKRAKEFIYIEDQYFTPNAEQPTPDLTNEQNVRTLFDALLAAEVHCRRLLIVVPEETDQMFGDVRRQYLFAELKKQWGDRLVVGTILRRPLLSAAPRITSQGRCILWTGIDATATSVTLGPASRIPDKAPFWFWIDGELMQSRVDAYGFFNNEYMTVEVERGLWGASKREHKKGAAVTVSQIKGIYVHAKLMVVDDIFVSIGSANLNRRGLYHDGEINVFAVPEQLKAATDNPARALRTALWAEHLGLPPSMGPALLADPMASFELFRRKLGHHGRFVPLSEFPAKPSIAFPPTGSILKMVFGIPVSFWKTANEHRLWDRVIDPTGSADPDPRSGPIPFTP